ncbi:MAG: hypothetical protein LWX01_11655, partial [Deltaproteobacteria bacterium]|nr:hypothetical protein [Deltaproteobacteria bacterium]MDL1962327.1 hypothetical protein [Deltaproteobacteria bacterium]
RWNWCAGFSTGISLLISRIEKGRSKKWAAEQNVVVGLYRKCKRKNYQKPEQKYDTCRERSPNGTMII